MRQKVVAAISVIGLALGATASLLVSLHVADELSYDRLHTRRDRIYRVIREDARSTDGRFHAGVLGPIGGMLEAAYPEIERAVRVSRKHALVKHGERLLGGGHSGWLVVDEGFEEVFDFKLYDGDLSKALAPPHSVVISPAVARDLFGDVSPIGESLEVIDKYVGGLYTITGILSDDLHQVSWPFTGIRFITRTVTQHHMMQSVWNRWRPESLYRPVSLYLLLREGVSPETLETGLEGFVERSFEPESRRGLKYHLQPLGDVHLHSQRDYGLGRGGDISQLQLLMGLAAFVVAIACTNFANLATAVGSLRAREVALRQTLGAVRRELMLQHWAQSVFMAAVAVLVAMGTTYLALPTVNAYTGKQLALDFLRPEAWVLAIGLALVIGVIAGAYPALYLSSLRPSVALRKFHMRGSTAIRSGLVLLQFTASIVLIFVTLVAMGQMEFVESKDLGFRADDVVVMDRVFDGEHADRIETIRDAFLRHPEVTMAAASHYPPGWGDMNPTTVRKRGESEQHALVRFPVDPDFLSLFEIPLVAGRDFEHERADDRGGTFILSEGAVQSLGYDTAEDALGEELHWLGVDGTVIGVVGDFHIKGLHHPLEPLFLANAPGGFNVLSLRVRPGADREALFVDLRKIYHRLHPQQPFSCDYLDVQLTNNYWADQQMRQLFGATALVGIVLSCLGVFGLSAFVAARRTREVGIRRVLGASTAQVAVRLLRDLSVPVLVAAVVSLPISYRIGQSLLQPFAYRMPLGVEPFLLSGLAALLLASMTTLWQVFRVAGANPVDAIRYE